MKDQVDALRAAGRAGRVPQLARMTPAERRRGRAAMLRAGELDLLYVSPGAAADADGFLAAAAIGAPASRSSPSTRPTASAQWGHDFRPEYLALVDAARALPGRAACIALTATATEPRARGHRRPSCGSRPRRCIVQLRPAEHPATGSSPSTTPPTQLLRSCAPARGRGRHRLLPVPRRRSTRPRSSCAAQGIPAAPYHAGLDASERAKNQEALPARATSSSWWPPSPSAWASTSQTSASWSTATCRKIVEGYYQETGRGPGRAAVESLGSPTGWPTSCSSAA